MPLEASLFICKSHYIHTVPIFPASECPDALCQISVYVKKKNLSLTRCCQRTNGRNESGKKKKKKRGI